jgi:hypothetical protein
MAANDIDDIIEVFVPELDSSAALACIAGGVVLGGIIIYALMQQKAAGRLRSPFGPSDEDSPVEVVMDTVPGTTPIPQTYYGQGIDTSLPTEG